MFGPSILLTIRREEPILNLEKYIERIKYKGHLSLSYDCLRDLHRCHVMSIPFEAMDVQLKKKISLDLPSIYDKVVLNERGGFCYELNYLFYSLLTTIGFDCKMISSRIFDDGVYGPEFDHMSLIVKLEDEWLIDVGYGDLFIEPLEIHSEAKHEGAFKNYRIEKLNESEFLLSQSLKDSKEFMKKYAFGLQSRVIDEFFDQCTFKQSSPDSYFVKNVICTKPTEVGRKTILNETFTIKTNDQVEKREIKGNDDLLEILREEFNISLRSKV